MGENLIYDIIISLLSGGSIAWVIIKLYVKDIAKEVVDDVIEAKQEELDKHLNGYVTKEQMQIERKELMNEVEQKFLTLAAFREFEKHLEENFGTINRRFSDSARRFDKLDVALEHITDLLIKKG